MADQTLSSNLIQGIVSTEKAKTSDAPILDKNFKSEESELLKNIIADDETAKGKAEIDSSLLIETKPKKSVLLIILKLVFVLVCLASIATVLFFTSQLTDTFDFVATTTNQDIPNLSKQVAAQNEDIVNKQTDLNFYRYLQAKMYVDQFSYYGDTFMKNFEIFNSKTSSSSERKKAKEDTVKLKEQLSTSFAATNEKLSSPIYTELVSLDYMLLTDPEKITESEKLFKGKLIAKLETSIKNLEKETSAEAKSDYKNYAYTLLLAKNEPLKKLFIGTKFEDLDTDQKLYNFIKQMNSMTVNDFSAMQVIKENRIRWSEIIKEIDQRTTAIDQYYSKDFYDEYGGIRYTSYDFDSKTGKISISGDTKRFDAKNFTMIASLIEELNNSDLFQGAEMRSFSKSGTVEDGFTANIQITTYLKSAVAKAKIAAEEAAKAAARAKAAKANAAKSAASVTAAN